MARRTRNPRDRSFGKVTVVKITHYLYILSSWSFVAEDAMQKVRARFATDLQYEWRIASTDYGGMGRLPRRDLEFYYARLEAATGRAMNLGWWRENYDWLVPDRTAVAARLLGATGSEVRLALAAAGLERGENITHRDTAIAIACSASGLQPAALAAQFDHASTHLAMYAEMQQFRASGVNLRPAFVLENELGDIVALSGIWNVEPLESAVNALLTDEKSYKAFVVDHPVPRD
ncbi:MAG: hypothetical protein M3N13_09060 [Candidatus Eremiobacteraeota bacterium]|nr:hypothetical protein [Candidatus Eremiobacteraeota bacterium]